MKENLPRSIHLKDYEEPKYWITKTDLTFDIFDDHTVVTACLQICRNKSANSHEPLVLHGQDLELLSVTLNKKLLTEDDFRCDSDCLTIKNAKETNTLICVTRIKPHENTSLEGLYKSSLMYCTQCEAEGFRKITYYLDRPDVMSEFTTKIIADKASCPILLSNGNLIDESDVEGNRHFATWHDPFKKPCYLFALVAGNLVNIDDYFMTSSGRNVLLRIYVEEKDRDKVGHAMTSLKNAMKWDEDVYGREYDLDIFMIVAVDDFNMGAMENKGLNIFNTSCVLAKPETTTDEGFQRVEGVVAHEYFHNWSGNRVTCRDWFQLSLKEGFTVFRDEEFSADMGSRTVKRVEDVSLLRTVQFAEDAGPMAHPVQPPSFIEISNFYTTTVYEKGAEVVRMIRTLLGNELFRKGCDLYFERHDGQAVTIDDFVNAMADVSRRDFSQFMNWYRQAGTPELKAYGVYDSSVKTFTLTFSQSCPDTRETDQKQPFHIPIAMGLIGKTGSLPLKIQGVDQGLLADNGTQVVLELTEEKQSFVFEKVQEPPVPSLLREFSAPVKLNYDYSRDDLKRIMNLDDDGFCRWDASQQLAVQVINEVMASLVNEPSPKVDSNLLDAYTLLLEDKSLDPAMVALMLNLPSETYIGELQSTIDVDAIHHARNRVERKVASELYNNFLEIYHQLHDRESYRTTAAAIAKRSLKNIALHYLVVNGTEEAIDLCLTQFKTAENMTDELSALTALVHSTKPSLAEIQTTALDSFYNKWQNEALVVNQWFAVQSSNTAPNALATVRSLMEHPAFDIKNPNKLRAVIGSFASRNPINFHHRSGSGYEFLADKIIYLNQTNPQIAARMLTPLTKWRKYDENRQSLMKTQLQRINAQPNLSKDVYEIVDKCLL